MSDPRPARFWDSPPAPRPLSAPPPEDVVSEFETRDSFVYELREAGSIRIPKERNRADPSV
jgi:hypothetical protein